jgi:hypothetical protein
VLLHIRLAKKPEKPGRLAWEVAVYRAKSHSREARTRAQLTSFVRRLELLQ